MSDMVTQFAQTAHPGTLTAIGAGISQIMQQRRAEEAARAQEENYRNLLSTYIRTKNPEDLFRVYEAAPQGKLDALKQGFEAMDEAQRLNVVQQNMEIIGPLASGMPDIALNNLETLRQGYENAGNVQKANEMKGFIDTINSGPMGESAVMDYLSLTTGVTPEGQEALKSMFALQGERRAQAVSEADLLKIASDLKFTGEGLANAIRTAEGNNMQTAKKILEFAEKRQSGTLDTEDIFRLERDLSDDYQKSIGNYNEILAANDAVKAIGDLATGAGDQALIVLFNKMLDPGSVVRESEAAATMRSQGVLQQIEAGISRLVTGEKLSPQLRSDIIDATGKLMTAAKGMEERARTRLMSPVESYGLDEDNVFGPGEAEAPGLIALREFIKTNNPDTRMNIDEMTEEELEKAFPVGVSAYREQVAPAGQVETMTSADFFNLGGQ